MDTNKILSAEADVARLQTALDEAQKVLHAVEKTVDASHRAGRDAAKLLKLALVAAVVAAFAAVAVRLQKRK